MNIKEVAMKPKLILTIALILLMILVACDFSNFSIDMGGDEDQ